MGPYRKILLEPYTKQYTKNCSDKLILNSSKYFYFYTRLSLLTRVDKGRRGQAKVGEVGEGRQG